MIVPFANYFDNENREYRSISEETIVYFTSATNASGHRNYYIRATTPAQFSALTCGDNYNNESYWVIKNILSFLANHGKYVLSNGILKNCAFSERDINILWPNLLYSRPLPFVMQHSSPSLYQNNETQSRSPAMQSCFPWFSTFFSACRSSSAGARRIAATSDFHESDITTSNLSSQQSTHTHYTISNTSKRNQLADLLWDAEKLTLPEFFEMLDKHSDGPKRLDIIVQHIDVTEHLLWDLYIKCKTLVDLPIDALSKLFNRIHSGEVDANTLNAFYPN